MLTSKGNIKFGSIVQVAGEVEEKDDTSKKNKQDAEMLRGQTKKYAANMKEHQPNSRNLFAKHRGAGEGRAKMFAKFEWGKKWGVSNWPESQESKQASKRAAFTIPKHERERARGLFWREKVGKL